MTPSHSQGMAAARRVQDGYEQRGACEADDAITMHTYQISVELRRLPEGARLTRARLVVQNILDNTRESLEPDDDE